MHASHSLLCLLAVKSAVRPRPHLHTWLVCSLCVWLIAASDLFLLLCCARVCYGSLSSRVLQHLILLLPVRV